MKPVKVPPIVSRRNHFRAADELVQDALELMPDQFKHEKFEAWLLRYTETVIKSVASHYGLAAQRGIEQAADLLCDPEYYAKRREHRAEARKQWREQQAKQEWERAERQLAPTAEQIEDSIKWNERQLAYYQGLVEKHEIALAKIRSTSPTKLPPVPKTLQ